MSRYPFADAKDCGGVGMQIRVRRENAVEQGPDLLLPARGEAAVCRVADDRVGSVVRDDLVEVTSVVGVDLALDNGDRRGLRHFNLPCHSAAGSGLGSRRYSPSTNDGATNQPIQGETSAISRAAPRGSLVRVGKASVGPPEVVAHVGQCDRSGVVLEPL